LRTIIILFVVILVLFGAVGVGTFFTKDAHFTPEFAMDLRGGTQLVLRPVAMNGNQKPTSTQMNQAVAIIRQRVDASGVAEPEIQVNGTTNIVVGIPGEPTDAELALVSKSAQMTFRSVLKTDQATTPSPAAWLSRAYPAPSASPSESASAEASAAASPSASASASSTKKASASASASASPSASASASAGSSSAVPAMSDFDSRLAKATDTSIISDEDTTKYDNIDCSRVGSDVNGAVSDPNKVLVTCSDNMGTAAQPYYEKYILGPVLVEGDRITKANSGMEATQSGGTTGQWVVNLELNTSGPIQSNGAQEFMKVTQKIQGLSTPLNQFAIVLDDKVVSAPKVDEPIPNGRAQISGNFTQASSKSLADQLSFGSLPLNFVVQSREQVSASLGSDQLEKGLLAGLIGLILVAIYSLFQYRCLGFVTISALILAVGFSYGCILLLSWVQGYRLSLAGVCGMIVSIGMTADSFIVYFERLKDELRDGRTLAQAIDNGWHRARRTILASDTVNALAAVVLYIVSVGSVRGFAFTLGLTTIMDVVVVFCFTHPMILLLSHTEFFGNGHPASGLDPHRLGAPGSIHYAGRGRLKKIPDNKAKKRGGTPTVTAIETSGSVAARKAARAQESAGAGKGTATAVLDKPRTTAGAKPHNAVPKGTGSLAERKAAAAAAQAESDRAAREAVTEDAPKTDHPADQAGDAAGAAAPETAPAEPAADTEEEEA
jgi:preprotein translocase subunit SecD